MFTHNYGMIIHRLNVYHRPTSFLPYGMCITQRNQIYITYCIFSFHISLMPSIGGVISMSFLLLNTGYSDGIVTHSLIPYNNSISIWTIHNSHGRIRRFHSRCRFPIAHPRVCRVLVYTKLVRLSYSNGIAGIIKCDLAYVHKNS